MKRKAENRKSFEEEKNQLDLHLNRGGISEFKRRTQSTHPIYKGKSESGFVYTYIEEWVICGSFLS